MKLSQLQIWTADAESTVYTKLDKQNPEVGEAGNRIFEVFVRETDELIIKIITFITGCFSSAGFRAEEASCVLLDSLSRFELRSCDHVASGSTCDLMMSLRLLFDTETSVWTLWRPSASSGRESGVWAGRTRAFTHHVCLCSSDEASSPSRWWTLSCESVKTTKILWAEREEDWTLTGQETRAPLRRDDRQTAVWSSAAEKNQVIFTETVFTADAQLVSHSHVFVPFVHDVKAVLCAASSATWPWRSRVIGRLPPGRRKEAKSWTSWNRNIVTLTCFKI